MLFKHLCGSDILAFSGSLRLLLHHWRISASASPVEATYSCRSKCSRPFSWCSIRLFGQSCHSSELLLLWGVWARGESWSFLEPGLPQELACLEPLAGPCLLGSEAGLLRVALKSVLWIWRERGGLLAGFVNKANLEVASWLKSANREDTQELFSSP